MIDTIDREQYISRALRTNEVSLLFQLPVNKAYDYRDAALLVDRVGGVLEVENYSVVVSFFCPRK